MGTYGEEETSYEEKDDVFWQDFEADFKAWSIKDAEQDYEEHLYEHLWVMEL